MNREKLRRVATRKPLGSSNFKMSKQSYESARPDEMLMIVENKVAKQYLYPHA